MNQGVSTTSDPPSGPTPQKQLPAYLRIANELRTQIDTQQLRANDPLAPERELCLTWNVSRMTARRALGVLEREGRVYRDKTRGTFVSEPKVKLRLGSFSQEVTRAGGLPGADLFWAEQRAADEEIATGLSLKIGRAVYALQRLRSSNGEPLAIETTYYRADLVPKLLEGDLSGSLWEEIQQRYALSLSRAEAELQVIVLDAEAGAQLNCRAGAGGLQMTRRTFTSDGECLEYAVDVYRADRVSLIIERTITPDPHSSNTSSL